MQSNQAKGGQLPGETRGKTMEHTREETLAKIDGLYRDSSQPVAALDSRLSVIWANAAAYARYPFLKTPDGLRTLIPEERLLRLGQAVAAGQAQLVGQGELPYLFTTICLTPLGQPGEEALILASFQPPSGNDADFDSGQNQILSALSGQIRGPLHTIFTALASVARKKDVRGTPALYEPLAVINRSCYQIFRHCLNLSEYTRLGGIQQAASPAACELSSLLEELCHSTREHIWGLGIPLEFTAKAPSVTCLCDSGMLQTAFFNILSNACRYTREGNAIHVTLEARGTRALIRIADRGTGIPGESLPHIFEPFFSLPGPDGVPGCGLGLTVAKMCMAAQEGGISVESRQGRGTTVSLSLPLTPPSQELTLDAARPEMLLDRFSPLYILLSDVCPPPEP